MFRLFFFFFENNDNFFRSTISPFHTQIIANLSAFSKFSLNAVSAEQSSLLVELFEQLVLRLHSSFSSIPVPIHHILEMIASEYQKENPLIKDNFQMFLIDSFIIPALERSALLLCIFFSFFPSIIF